MLGTPERPLRAAIIGSGPSGFYTAEVLLKTDRPIAIDMFERLPTPYGLVRYGVAPDHPKIKNVIKIYEKIIQNGKCRFWGNVTIGQDIAVEELKKFYDAIIFACGAETDRHLNIPGEGLKGSHTATEFVAWYNGRPEYRHHHFNLSSETAVIIGQGNVAVDVCRILAKTADELKNTDICQHALEALSQSHIKEVHMIGRRGPVQAAFTPIEVRELEEFLNCEVVIDPKDLELNEASQRELEDPHNAPKKKNLEILKHLSASPKGGKKRKLFLHFFKSPIEFKGSGQIERIILEKNELTGEPGHQKAKGTGIIEELKCGIVFCSIGYRGIPIPGVPFDHEKGIIPNIQGRVVSHDGTTKFYPGLYCTGWIKRGPVGVIGTNKADAEETVHRLIEDIPQLEACEQPSTEGLLGLLRRKNIHVITFEDWKKIDASEIARGQKLGKPREKFVSIEEMLNFK